MPADITNMADMIDVRDIIARVEELESDETEDNIDSLIQTDDADELVSLRELLSELSGNGGDEQWRGDWYPGSLIRYSYFKEYAQQLADDLGAINAEATWPNNCIDWDMACRDLKQDYSSIDYDGVEYFYR